MDSESNEAYEEKKENGGMYFCLEESEDLSHGYYWFNSHVFYGNKELGYDFNCRILDDGYALIDCFLYYKGKYVDIRSREENYRIEGFQSFDNTAIKMVHWVAGDDYDTFFIFEGKIISNDFMLQCFPFPTKDVWEVSTFGGFLKLLFDVNDPSILSSMETIIRNFRTKSLKRNMHNITKLCKEYQYFVMLMVLAVRFDDNCVLRRHGLSSDVLLFKIIFPHFTELEVFVNFRPKLFKIEGTKFSTLFSNIRTQKNLFETIRELKTFVSRFAKGCSEKSQWRETKRKQVITTLRLVMELISTDKKNGNFIEESDQSESEFFESEHIIAYLNREIRMDIIELIGNFLIGKMGMGNVQTHSYKRYNGIFDRGNMSFERLRDLFKCYYQPRNIRQKIPMEDQYTDFVEIEKFSLQKWGKRCFSGFKLFRRELSTFLREKFIPFARKHYHLLFKEYRERVLVVSATYKVKHKVCSKFNKIYNGTNVNNRWKGLLRHDLGKLKRSLYESDALFHFFDHVSTEDFLCMRKEICESLDLMERINFSRIHGIGTGSRDLPISLEIWFDIMLNHFKAGITSHESRMELLIVLFRMTFTLGGPMCSQYKYKLQARVIETITSQKEEELLLLGRSTDVAKVLTLFIQHFPDTSDPCSLFHTNPKAGYRNFPFLTTIDEVMKNQVFFDEMVKVVGLQRLSKFFTSLMKRIKFSAREVQTHAREFLQFKICSEKFEREDTFFAIETLRFEGEYRTLHKQMFKYQNSLLSICLRIFQRCVEMDSPCIEISEDYDEDIDPPCDPSKKGVLQFLDICEFIFDRNLRICVYYIVPGTWEEKGKHLCVDQSMILLEGILEAMLKKNMSLLPHFQNVSGVFVLATNCYLCPQFPMESSGFRIVCGLMKRLISKRHGMPSSMEKYILNLMDYLIGDDSIPRLKSYQARMNDYDQKSIEILKEKNLVDHLDLLKTDDEFDRILFLNLLDNLKLSEESRRSGTFHSIPPEEEIGFLQSERFSTARDVKPRGSMVDKLTHSLAGSIFDNIKPSLEGTFSSVGCSLPEMETFPSLREESHYLNCNIHCDRPCFSFLDLKPMYCKDQVFEFEYNHFMDTIIEYLHDDFSMSTKTFLCLMQGILKVTSQGLLCNNTANSLLELCKIASNIRTTQGVTDFSEDDRNTVTVCFEFCTNIAEGLANGKYGLWRFKEGRIIFADLLAAVFDCYVHLRGVSTNIEAHSKKMAIVVRMLFSALYSGDVYKDMKSQGSSTKEEELGEFELEEKKAEIIENRLPQVDVKPYNLLIFSSSEVLFTLWKDGVLSVGDFPFYLCRIFPPAKRENSEDVEKENKQRVNKAMRGKWEKVYTEKVRSEIAVTLPLSFLSLLREYIISSLTSKEYERVEKVYLSQLQFTEVSDLKYANALIQTYFCFLIGEHNIEDLPKSVIECLCDACIRFIGSVSLDLYQTLVLFRNRKSEKISTGVDIGDINNYDFSVSGNFVFRNLNEAATVGLEIAKSLITRGWVSEFFVSSLESCLMEENFEFLFPKIRYRGKSSNDDTIKAHAISGSSDNIRIRRLGILLDLLGPIGKNNTGYKDMKSEVEMEIQKIKNAGYSSTRFDRGFNDSNITSNSWSFLKEEEFKNTEEEEKVENEGNLTNNFTFEPIGFDKSSIDTKDNSTKENTTFDIVGSSWGDSSVDMFLETSHEINAGKVDSDGFLGLDIQSFNFNEDDSESTMFEFSGDSVAANEVDKDIKSKKRKKVTVKKRNRYNSF